MPNRLLFLPGASGNPDFWRPVADRLTHAGDRRRLGWPGFGPTPADPAVNGIDDLVAQVSALIDRPTDLIAQSMGGIIAVRAALDKPDLVRHLVLTVTSGGIDMRSLGAQDWRPAFRAANPHLPPWFLHEQEDLTARLAGIQIPVLLLWGDADPISPVAVGQQLERLFPNARLHVIPGGTHDLAYRHAEQIAPLIDAHLSAYAPPHDSHAFQRS